MKKKEKIANFMNLSIKIRGGQVEKNNKKERILPIKPYKGYVILFNSL
jgi:hypothetical protein